MSRRCDGCGYSVKRCTDDRADGYLACCPDCRHLAAEVAGMSRRSVFLLGWFLLMFAAGLALAHLAAGAGGVDGLVLLAAGTASAGVVLTEVAR